ncbi:N-acyl-D-amino-acid deacylase family protein [Kaistia granuli]|uniref:N-acyl-D-amino-acid deacylase family protein n=1 Tax=Kaistia granuli TaxID=363259 RepID=UPI0003626A3B|nr:D-aminoacylase [Kaistia granuli]
MMRPAHDLVLRNAQIYDGAGGAPYPGDVALTGDRITAVGVRGTIAPGSGEREQDLGGLLAVAPGFIDAHTHDDRIVLDAPDMLPKISQGVTSVVVGNCGISLAPVTFGDSPPPPMNLLGDASAYEFPNFAAYAAAISRAVPAVNIAALIGHSALRLATMRDIGEKASPNEIAAMQAHADEAMAHGAIGLSSGLFYPTNAAADIDEVTRVAGRFAQHGGVYATHMRDEFEHVLDSIDETVTTATAAGIPLVISHHKCAGVHNWGRTLQTLPKIEAAASHHPVNVDVYPYAAGSTNLRADLVTDTYRIMIAWSRPHPEMEARDLVDIAGEWEVDIHEAARRLQPAGAIYFQMDEADVRRVMSSKLAMIGSDGLPHDQHPHPRLWGTFPRVIGHYARDQKLFPIETAIHKMTGLPAKVFKLEGRGRIEAGAYADLVVFNPATILDQATYDQPLRRSIGIEQVYVNGRLSFTASAGVVARAGQLIGGRN